MTDHAKAAGVRTAQELVRVLGPSYGTGFFTYLEERVLSLRIAHDQTLAQTGKIVGRLEGCGPLTRERVRRIETKALRRWREHFCPHCGGVIHSANAEAQGRREATYPERSRSQSGLEDKQ